MQEKQEPSLKEALIDYFFREHEFIFILVYVVGLILVVGLNWLASITVYQNLMLGVGWTQAVITGYLSFKIFEVSKRDSELPDLSYGIVDVEDLGSPYDNHFVIRCTVGFRNTAFGRAKIKNIEISADYDQRLLERHKTPGEGKIAHGFPEGRPIPVILDKGEQVNVMFQVNGFNYLDSISLEITDDVMGTQEVQLLLSEISNQLAMKEWDEEAEEEI